jgi:hypothetical protein
VAFSQKIIDNLIESWCYGSARKYSRRNELFDLRRLQREQPNFGNIKMQDNRFFTRLLKVFSLFGYLFADPLKPVIRFISLQQETNPIGKN